MMNDISETMQEQKEFNSQVSVDAIDIRTGAEQIKQISQEQKYAAE
jgi:hypothetical protein